MTLLLEEVAAIAASAMPSAEILEVLPLRGGLEGCVARVTIRQSERRRHIVVKRIATAENRERSRYELLGASGVVPSLLGSRTRDGFTYLFLEHVRPVQHWPWRDSTNTRLVLDQLARIHALGASAARQDDWNYEAELRASAAETVLTAEWLASALPALLVGRNLRSLRRVAGSLADARAAAMEPFGRTLIHGDVHTRNVVLRRINGRSQAVLLDWGRSRVGSPLEDVSSWLLSLRGWEPAAARDHDTLLRSYLAAAGRPMALTSELRDAYWVAAASNAMAGALRYQLLVAHETSGRRRVVAMTQAQGALRVIHRAAERLRARPHA